MSSATELTYSANSKVRDVTESEKKKLESLLQECHDEITRGYKSQICTACIAVLTNLLFSDSLTQETILIIVINYVLLRIF